MKVLSAVMDFIFAYLKISAVLLILFVLFEHKFSQEYPYTENGR